MINRSFSNKIARISTFVLVIFVIFSLGLWFGQTKDVQLVLRVLRSGEWKSSFLPYAKEGFDKQITVWSAIPHALQGGALLIGTQFSDNPALLLVNDVGQILQSWQVETKVSNDDVIRFWKKIPDEKPIFAIEDAHLLPDGGVIFTQDLRAFNNYRGQRLVRIDRSSHVLWQIQGTFSHEFDVGGNPQRIFAITSDLRHQLPLIGPPLQKTLYLDDQIKEYTLDGHTANSWSIANAFVNSKYSSYLLSFEINLPSMQRIITPEGDVLYDLLHPDSLQYLKANQAKALPFAEEGDLLLSLRGLNAIAVFRPSNGQIVWASFGPWRHQHNARVTEDGRLTLFDNEGSHRLVLSLKGEPKEEPQSRVIQYDPSNNQMTVIFASPQIYSFWRGVYIALPDRSSIVGSDELSRILVVSPHGEIEWELRGVPDRHLLYVPDRKQFSSLRYYPASALSFLDAEKGL